MRRKTEWNKLAQKWDPITLICIAVGCFRSKLTTTTAKSKMNCDSEALREIYEGKRRTQRTWITSKPCRRFFALHCSSGGCMPWRWAIPATPTFAVRFVDSHDYCCTTVSYRIRRVFSLRVIARFVLIVVSMWPQLSGSLFLMQTKRDRCVTDSRNEIN